MPVIAILSADRFADRFADRVADTDTQLVERLQNIGVTPQKPGHQYRQEQDDDRQDNYECHHGVFLTSHVREYPNRPECCLVEHSTDSGHRSGASALTSGGFVDSSMT
jgi:hypothetical protein